MYFHEEKMDLLSVPQGYMLAHCISGDFALGAGIAKQIDNAFNMREMLRRTYGEELVTKPGCFVAMNVYNLVTKTRFWHKPTLDSLHEALTDMRMYVVDDGVKKIAMPRIGCGLDKLDWEDVSQIIQEVFRDTDVEILVCYL